MLRLHDCPDTGNGYGVRLRLGRLAVRFEMIALDILEGETRMPEFLTRNPDGPTPGV